MPSPNPNYISADHPQWRPVPGKPGIWVHDDQPDQEVEIIHYECQSCTKANGNPIDSIVYHGVTHDPERGFHAATDEERGQHATCRHCEQELTRIEP